MPETKEVEKTQLLWQNRLAAHAQKDVRALTEMRRRAGRVVPESWKKEVAQTIETSRTGKVGRETGRTKVEYVAPKVRVSVPQTRSVGVGAEDRARVAKVNNPAFERLKNEASTARVESAIDKAEASRKTFAKPMSKTLAAK